MCNLYAITKSQEAIRQAAKALRDKAGNVPPLPGIFPDQMAPIVRTGDDGKRELVMMRWGFPSPPIFGNPRAVTNVRNVKSNYWKRWLQPEHRCLVPATSFCEYHDKPDPKTKRKTPHWFALFGKASGIFLCGHLATVDRHTRNQSRSRRRRSRSILVSHLRREQGC